MRVGRNYVDLSWDPPSTDGGKLEQDWTEMILSKLTREEDKMSPTGLSNNISEQVSYERWWLDLVFCFLYASYTFSLWIHKDVIPSI